MDNCLPTPLHTLDIQQLHELPDESKYHATESLESGQVIFLPNYAFLLDSTEKTLLSESVLHPKSKNISYDYTKQQLSGLTTSQPSNALADVMLPFMYRFAEYSRQLVDTLLPQYREALQWGRTSYRPAEIKGRKTSKRKDDTRLHIDAFASTPVNGRRILRVFSNINPYGEPRVWHVGEPFQHVVDRFSPHIPPFSPLRARLLKWVFATKAIRSPYDHSMLHLHDKMKLDNTYQNTVPKQRIEFPPQTTWIVFTDHVSHAALSGQFLLEQTFYLPVEAMQNSALSPLKCIA